MRLTKKDVLFLNHALDILSADYDPENGHDDYRYKMQKDIAKMRDRLDAMLRPDPKLRVLKSRAKKK